MDPTPAVKPTAPLPSSGPVFASADGAAAAVGARPLPVEAPLHHRLRAGLYLAFALLAALLLLQVDTAHRHAPLSASHAQWLEAALLERARVGELARHAATASVPGPAGGSPSAARYVAIDLADELDVASSLLEGMVVADLAPAWSGDPNLEAAARVVGERLVQWKQAHAALQRTVHRLRFDEDVAAAVPLHRAAREAEPAAQALVESLRQLAVAQQAAAQRQVRGWVAVSIGLLALLALVVVEPVARGVGRQLWLLGEQSRHLQRLALVAERTEAVVTITDRDHRIVWANAAFERITGHPLAAAQGLRPSELIHHPGTAPEAEAALAAAVAQGRGARTECLFRRRDGRDLWLDCDLQPVSDAAGALTGFVSVNHDVTERRRLHEQLQDSSRTDALTRLPNRSVVMERLKAAIAHARRHPRYGFAVLFMDFDRFKQVNDTLGHGAGDELLRQIAVRLQTTLRPGDTVAALRPAPGTAVGMGAGGGVDDEAHAASAPPLAARLGGDEFVVLLERVSEVADACHIAELLLQALTEPYLLGSHGVRSSASIGIVVVGAGAGLVRGADDRSARAGDADVAAEAEAVLRDADTAMYEAKRTRPGGWVVFDRSMQDRIVHALQLERELRRALQGDELFVVYQPVVKLPGGELAGVEALVRWRHPERGAVPPAAFIGVAEECGLIGALGSHVLRSACAEFARWRQELGALAPPLLSVNVSSAQLRTPGLVDEVARVLADTGLPPRALQLELTESLAAQGEQVQATLRALKALGVRLALDDFGTGYSSLACLDQLPVDTVKIDRSFVANAGHVEYRRVLIEATIRVARTLGMTTVAEGIETAPQAQQMALLQCDMGQGWHFSAALDAPALRRWVQERGPGGTAAAAHEAAALPG